jgi:hypothetical protein
MSQAYIDVVERFIKLQDIMYIADKNFKKNPKRTARIASMLALSSIFSNFPLDKQYAVYKAMKQTMFEQLENYKALGDSVDEIAATLIFASEIKKHLKL